MPANCQLVSGGVVPFEEDSTSPSISLTRDSRSITRTGRIAWANIDAAIAECYPAAPAILGAHPTASWLYVDTVEMKPQHPLPAIDDISTTGGVASYTGDAGWAHLTITYTRLPFDQEPAGGGGGTDFLTRRWSFGAEMLTIPASKLRWENGGAPIEVRDENITAAKLIPTLEHSITVHRKTSINWTAIRENIGKVNDGTWEGAADQTLLFAGGEVTFTFSTDGTKLYTLDLRFQERRIKEGVNIYGWNHFFRNDAAKPWDRLLDKDGNPIYGKSSTFSDLFH